MTLKTRKLGAQGLEVSAIGLGCMGMSQSYGPADETESLATLDSAIELGCDFFDTAQGYRRCKSEPLLGRAFKGRRDKVIIATKFGFRLKGGARETADMTSRPQDIKDSVRYSLKRLRSDH